MKKITALILALTLVLSISVFNFADVKHVIVAQADTGGFTDVSASHWAYADIKALTDGKLLNGMGDGTFQPEGKLTIAQLAKLICTAKGLGGNASGYWAADYIRICQNDIHCLPDFGDPIAANYDVECTRELAAYMIVRGLGTKTSTYLGKELTDIPDYAHISYTPNDYRDAVLRAYNTKLINGIDEKGTFDPQGKLTRAQAAAILHRAGFTTAGTPATPPAEGSATAADSVKIGETVKSWSEYGWVDHGRSTWHSLWSTGKTYAGVQVEYDTDDPGVIKLTLHENVSEYWTEQDRHLVMTHTFSDGKTPITVPSGFSYEARQVAYRVLKEAFPTGYEEAYDAMIHTMKQDIFEVPGRSGAGALRWIDGRCFEASLGSANHTLEIFIDAVGDTKTYDLDRADAEVRHRADYMSYIIGAVGLTQAYELDRK